MRRSLGIMILQTHETNFCLTIIKYYEDDQYGGFPQRSKPPAGDIVEYVASPSPKDRGNFYFVPKTTLYDLILAFGIHIPVPRSTIFPCPNTLSSLEKLSTQVFSS
jgi:hypothetical protein